MAGCDSVSDEKMFQKPRLYEALSSSVTQNANRSIMQPGSEYGRSSTCNVNEDRSWCWLSDFHKKSKHANYFQVIFKWMHFTSSLLLPLIIINIIIYMLPNYFLTMHILLQQYLETFSRINEVYVHIMFYKGRSWNRTMQPKVTFETVWFPVLQHC